MKAHKVKELIEELRKLDPEATIAKTAMEDDIYYIGEPIHIMSASHFTDLEGGITDADYYID